MKCTRSQNGLWLMWCCDCEQKRLKQQPTVQPWHIPTSDDTFSSIQLEHLPTKLPDNHILDEVFWFQNICQGKCCISFQFQNPQAKDEQLIFSLLCCLFRVFLIMQLDILISNSYLRLSLVDWIYWHLVWVRKSISAARLGEMTW